MIEGTVNDALEAVIVLQLQGADGRTQEIQAVVDTGYSGFLTIPLALVADLSLPFAYMGRAYLANDAEVSFDVHYATVMWDGLPREIEADATGSVPLVGMQLLEEHSLHIAVTPGGRTAIQSF